MVGEKAALESLLSSIVTPGALSSSLVSFRRIDAACHALELTAHEKPSFPRDLNLLTGRWRLVYTSGPVVALAMAPDTLFADMPCFTLPGSMLTEVIQEFDIPRRTLTEHATLSPQLMLPQPISPRFHVTFEYRFVVEGEAERVNIRGAGQRRKAGLSSRIRSVLQRVKRSSASAADWGGLLPGAIDLGGVGSTLRIGSKFDTTYCDDRFRISRCSQVPLCIFERVAEDSDEPSQEDLRNSPHELDTAFEDNGLPGAE